MKPKVLIIIDTYYIGGAGKVILQFLENADHSKFDYALGTFRYRNPPSTEFIDAARSSGIKVELFDQRFTLDPSPLWQVYWFIKRDNYNIIETHGYKGHLIASIISRLLSIPWIGVTHGWTAENIKVELYNKLDRWLLKNADQAVSVSPELFNEMKRIRGNNKKTDLVMNSIDDKPLPTEGRVEEIRNSYKFTEDTVLLGVFGRLSPEKGHAILIKACSKVLEQLDASLLIVGDGQERGSLVDLVRTLGISDRVIFEGLKKNMGDYYIAIDLLILPSLSEGLPFVVLEAMAAGKPVLATDVGAMSEVIRNNDNGWLVTPGNVEVLKDKLIKVLSNKDVLGKIGVRAQESLVPRFKAKRQCDEILLIYQKLVEH